jgi:membrane protease YdiL (CAAX protease family)
MLARPVSRPFTGLKDVIARHPLSAVFGLAFGFTWLIILAQLAALYGLPSIPIPLPAALLVGSYGFVWAALIVTGAAAGLAGIRALLGRYMRWRVGIQWYLLAIFGPLLYMLIGLGLYRLFDGAIASAPLFNISPLRVLEAFLPNLALIALTNPEELVWRGVALPQLQRRHSALIATLMLAAVEGLWHLPYFFVPGHFIQQLGVIGFVAWNVALAIIFTWVFNSTGGNLLIVTLLHAAGNAWEPFLTVPGTVAPVYCMIAVLWAAAIIVLVVCGPTHLRRLPKAHSAGPPHIAAAERRA